MFAANGNSTHCTLLISGAAVYQIMTHNLLQQAIVHEEQCRLQRAWRHWTQRTEQRIHEKEKQTASERLYLYRLLHKTMTQWKDNSSEIRDRWSKRSTAEETPGSPACLLNSYFHVRRDRELLACRRGDLCCVRWAVEKWKQVSCFFFSAFAPSWVCSRCLPNIQGFKTMNCFSLVLSRHVSGLP